MIEDELLGEVTVTGFGLNVPLELPGRPVTVRLTLPLKVFRGVKVIGNVALLPAWIVPDVLLDEMEKSGTSTTSVTVVVCVRVPSVPVMVNV